MCYSFETDGIVWIAIWGFSSPCSILWLAESQGGGRGGGEEGGRDNPTYLNQSQPFLSLLLGLLLEASRSEPPIPRAFHRPPPGSEPKQYWARRRSRRPRSGQFLVNLRYLRYAISPWLLVDQIYDFPVF